MTVDNIVSIMELLSFIAAIVSLVLAIVAIAFSVLFYILGRKDSMTIQERAKEISSHTEVLKSLFDVMMKTSFDMIKENSSVMHKYMLATVGRTKESLNESSKEAHETEHVGNSNPIKEDQSMLSQDCHSGEMR